MDYATSLPPLTSFRVATMSFRAERGISVPFAKRKGTRRVKRDAGDARGGGEGARQLVEHPP